MMPWYFSTMAALHPNRGGHGGEQTANALCATRAGRSQPVILGLWVCATTTSDFRAPRRPADAAAVPAVVVPRYLEGDVVVAAGMDR